MVKIENNTFEILSVIFEEMEHMCSACKELINDLETINVYDEQKRNVRNGIICKIRNYINFINLHQNLYNVKLIKIDFYSVLNNFFPKNKNKKTIRFVVQEGFDGIEKKDLTKEELSQYFTINNCLPLMELVPFQIAINARKYMPPETECIVKLLKTKTKSYSVW